MLKAFNGYSTSRAAAHILARPVMSQDKAGIHCNQQKDDDRRESLRKAHKTIGGLPTSRQRPPSCLIVPSVRNAETHRDYAESQAYAPTRAGGVGAAGPPAQRLVGPRSLQRLRQRVGPLARPQRRLRSPLGNPHPLFPLPPIRSQVSRCR